MVTFAINPLIPRYKLMIVFSIANNCQIFVRKNMSKRYSQLKYIFIILICLSMPAVDAIAFPTDTYAGSSALASGKWVKVSVSETGMHFISTATLRSWGFTDVTKVHIHGYGGQRVADHMTLANYRDDLPEVSTLATSAGIYFYGVGPVAWTKLGDRYYQQLNPFTTEGYYFLTDSGTGEPARAETEGSSATPGDPITQYEARLYHEFDRYTFSMSGTELFGEDFRSKRTQTFKFKLTDRVEGTQAWMRVSFAAKSSSRSTLRTTINGEKLPTTRTIDAAGDNYGKLCTFSTAINPTGEDTEIGITLENSGIVEAARLNGITINYTRALRLNGKSPLIFTLRSTTASLEGAGEHTHVWDVTNPETPIEMQTSVNGNSATWVNPYTGTREYIAWDESSTMLTPKMVCTVPNQNLHGIKEYPDMVIFTVKDFAGEAERLANLHRSAPDNFTVLVIDQDEVFNEFSSGSRDAGAFRRMMKMMYDRGNEAGKPLKYCVMFGRSLFDPRQLTDEAKNISTPFMPQWQSQESLIEGSTYCSDDVLCMLEDNSGNVVSNDKISVSIGRISAGTLSQAKNYVDKLYAFAENKQRSEWKNSIIIEADNGNEATFMVGSGATVTGVEGMHNSFIENPDASQFIFNKIYYDAYPIVGGVCEQADKLFKRAIEEGTMMWFYNGHGAISTLGGEGLHSLSKVSNMYNAHWPVLLALTCSFGQWDSPDPCGIERLCFNTQGGTIAAISASRKAIISDNDAFIVKLGETFLRRDESGQYMRLGDMLRASKNALLGASKAGAMTKLRYVFLGDPAMRLAVPDNNIVLESINGESVDPEKQVTIMANQRVTLTGTLYDQQGNTMDDFNGILSATIYDAETSVTTLGLNVDNTKGKAITFDKKGDKLFSGRGSVVNGHFTLGIAMPSEIADNFRPATINMYATSKDGREASGVCRDFYVYGFDDTAEPDTQPPLIDYAYLNHSSFTNGSIVNEQPMFIAGVTDDIGINLSMAGIGHQMSLKLDDERSFTDIALYYSPAPDGSPSGTIAYPISELPEGNHTLTFRVWDTSGNSATHSIDFFVEQGAAPQLFDIFTDANPASTHANFYLSHNRPDAPATVSLDIFSMSGRHIWSSTVTGRSDMFLSTPIQWDLCDMGGQRVIRGIYIYRATIKIDGHEITSQAKRIAVTGR